MLFEKHRDGICRGCHENRKVRRGTIVRIRQRSQLKEVRG